MRRQRPCSLPFYTYSSSSRRQGTLRPSPTLQLRIGRQNPTVQWTAIALVLVLAVVARQALGVRIARWREGKVHVNCLLVCTIVQCFLLHPPEYLWYNVGMWCISLNNGHSNMFTYCGSTSGSKCK